MDAGFFKGTSADQDNRFVDKNKKLMKTMKFGEGLDRKVDMSRVDMEIIRPWINKTVTDYLGVEDDVLFEFICNQLDDPLPDGRQMQVNVMGFLGAKNAREFVQKLWQLLGSAMDDICGIPDELKEQKKEQIRMKAEEQGRINETLKTHQTMIQEAIAKIKVNAAAAAINSRNLVEPLEKPSGRGRLTMGLSRSHSPRNARSANKGTKDSETGNAQTKASDRSAETGDAPRSGPKKSRTDDTSSRRKQSSYGRNRIRSPSPRKDRRRSREQSPYRKSSPRRRSRSPDSTRRDPSRRRSPSPHHSKTSPLRHRSHPSRQRRSLSPGRHGAHLSRHRPSHDDNQRRALPDVRADTPSKRSQGHSESSGSPRLRHERSRSRSSSAENARDGKTSEKQSVFHHRNYRSHGGGRRSSPEDAGASPKPTNPRGSRNGHKKSFSPALAARNDFSPQQKRSPRFSSSVAHRHYAPSPRQNQPPEGDSYPKLDPVYPSRRLSPHLSHSRSQRRSLSVSPGRRAKGQQWVNERRGVSPHSSRYDYHELPRLGEGLPEPSIRRNRNASPGGYHDNWGSTSKWDGVESRQRSPRALSEFERRARSPPIERQRVSPFPDRYVGQHEVRWPSSPRRDPRGAVGEYRAHMGAPRFEQPREDFDRGGTNAFNRGISHHRQRHGNSPFRRTVPYESDVREPVAEYYADLPPSRRGVALPALGPPSSLLDRHSRAYVRPSGPQRRDNYEPRGTPHGDKYPMRGLDRVEDNYNPPGDKFDPRFEQRGNCYDKVVDGYEPRTDRFDPRGGGHANDVLQTRKHLRDKGDYNSRGGNYEDRNLASRSDRVEDSRRSRSSHRSRSPKRSRSVSGPRSPNSPRSPQWTNRKAWKKENVEGSERDRHGKTASRTGQSASKERTEHARLDYEAKYRRPQQREGSRSLKRGRSTASSSPDGVSRSSNQARSPSGGVDRQGASVEPYNDHGKDFEDKRNERRANRSLSPSSPALPPAKRMKVGEEEGANSAEGSEVEVSSKKKKKKKEKKKKRKKHKKHKKHKHTKKSQEDENEDDSNTDRETQDDELASHTPESRSNVPDEEREFELREKAILSLKSSK